MTPTQAYILCATPRSGSTLLCAHLRASGVAGHPQSLFRREDLQEYADYWRITGPDGRYAFKDYLAAALIEGRGQTDTFALRLMWETLGELIGYLGGAALDGQADLLRRTFGPLRYIYLRRDDLIGQAISRHKAEVSGIWHVGIEESDHPATPHYDYDRILTHVREAEAANRHWQDWFAANGVTPFRITYEDLSQDPSAITREALAFLNLPAPPTDRVTVPNRKMADAESAAWAARFDAERRARGD
jgi:LPS sulfotransferase NodH